MRNLIVFIWKHNFFFLFFLLEVFCVYLLVKNNSYQRAGFVNSANKVTGTIYQTNADVKGYLNLKHSNELLAKENAELRSKVQDSFLKIDTTKKTIRNEVYRQQFSFMYGKVVNNSSNRRNNYLTLNIGSAQGVKKDMGVITSNGIVGRIKAVSENFSTVMSMLHKDSRISAKLKRDGSFGPLSWDGKDYRLATLSDIPTHVRIKKGDTIVTSAYSATFPEGILIGTVDSYERRSGEYFFTVIVKLSTDFKKLGYVYVVNSIFKEEQDSLETTSQND